MYFACLQIKNYLNVLAATLYNNNIIRQEKLLKNIVK